MDVEEKEDEEEETGSRVDMPWLREPLVPVDDLDLHLPALTPYDKVLKKDVKKYKRYVQHYDRAITAQFRKLASL